MEKKSDEFVAVAIDKDKSSQHALRWAIDHLLSRGQTVTLLHVKQKPSSIPTPMGSHVSLSEVNDGVAKAYKAQLEQQIKELFLPFRAFCARKDIKSNEVIIEDMDISKALCDYVRTNLVENMVLGSPSKYSFVRFKSSDIPTNVSKGAPEFCSVFIISKGKISSVRSATIPVPIPPPRPVQYQNNPTPTSSVDSNLMPNFSSKAIERASARNPMEDMEIKSPLPRKRGTANNRSYGGDLAIESDISFVNSGRPSFDHRFHNASPFDNQDLSMAPPRLSYGFYGENRPSFGSPSRSELDLIRGLSSSGSETASGSWQGSQNMDDLEAEMRRLKQELKQTMDMYSTACREALTAKQTAMELNRWKMEEQRRFEEARLAEEAALALAEKEKAKTKAAIEAAETARRIAELEAQKRMTAEMKAKKEADEKNQVLNVLAKTDNRYRKYSIEEIEIATDQFSDSRKIGEGGYGPVYKGYLDHTPVAIKVLRPDAAQGRSQFQQEVEVLSCIRHPNMVLLLGACPEYGCLVYDYMSNGSLEDCLFRKGKVPVLPWQVRFRIAAEIVTGLLFLHQAKPEPLVHRDLKPANILLDRNYVSKISDVGLARLVPPSVADSVTQYHMTSAAGTFCYIDPEYQQTGMLGIKSDIYSLGVMLLQIITAKPPMGLTHQVERAIERNTFAEVLDPAVPDWPVEEALGFAKLALQCAELRRKDRPDLKTVVLPELNRLRILGEESMPSSNLMFQPIGTLATSTAQSQVSVVSQDLISDPLMRHRSSQSPLCPTYISREED